MDVGLVCDGCRTFNAMGARGCARCGASISLDGIQRAPAAAAPAPTATDTRACSNCGNGIPSTSRFCGACGTPVRDENTNTGLLAKASGKPSAPTPRNAGASNKTLFFGAMQAARAKLVVIKGDGLDGVSFTLAGDEHQAGRGQVPLVFAEDPYLSPVHANFFYKSGKLVVRDEGSVNGVFLRIRGAVPYAFGDLVLIGEQVLEVQSTDAGAPADASGTFVYASPRKPSHFRILQRLRGGALGLAFQPERDVVSLGREGNDVDFPDDPFISGHHAEIRFEAGALTLADLGSKNGTFVRITRETPLEHGDYVFMGQQLLRVEIV